MASLPDGVPWIGPTVARRRTEGAALVGRRASADTLAPFIGQWVATSGPDVLVAAADPKLVVSWLVEHNQVAESMFRVPRDEFEADWQHESGS